MNAKLPSVHRFRLPTRDLNHAFLQSAGILLAAMVGASVLLPNGVGWNTPLLFGAIGIGAYFVTKRIVWLELTAEGIRGKGPTRRKVEFLWSQNITITQTTSDNLRGFRIESANATGAIAARIMSLFIPLGIARSPEFAVAVAELAPPEHPLRALSQDGGVPTQTTAAATDNDAR